MTLKEAMDYRGENAATMSDRLGVTEAMVKRWCTAGRMMKLTGLELRQIAQALDGGILITADGAEVELYG